MDHFVPNLDTSYHVSIIDTMFSSSLYSPEYDTLRKWLKTKRKAAKETTYTVGDTLGVSHSTISKLERGERQLDIIEYLYLCQALGVDPLEGIQLLKQRHRF